VIEHDGSLSRHDISSPTKDNNTFAPEIWATVKAHFDSSSETISIATAARARRARLAAARATNPQVDISPEQVRFSVLETCLYLRVFRAGAEGGEEGAARRAWVGVLFGWFFFFSFFFFLNKKTFLIDCCVADLLTGHRTGTASVCRGV
jgi:hypothetical protein